MLSIAEPRLAVAAMVAVTFTLSCGGAPSPDPMEVDQSESATTQQDGSENHEGSGESEVVFEAPQVVRANPIDDLCEMRCSIYQRCPELGQPTETVEECVLRCADQYMGRGHACRQSIGELLDCAGEMTCEELAANAPPEECQAVADVMSIMCAPPREPDPLEGLDGLDDPTHDIEIEQGPGI